MARFTTLYSGSSGNSAVIEEDGRYLLVDVGKSCRITTNALKALELDPAGLQGVLITHEHSDHVSGLKVFGKRNPAPVYASAPTLDLLAVKDQLSPGVRAEAIEGPGNDIGGFSVTAFPTSHDAIDCHGYRVVTPKGRTLCIATDLGCLTGLVHEQLSGADLVALESNYDPHMLRYGPYPYQLKVRIAGQRGHLSNPECAGKILELVQEGCEKFCLCHLSHENNTPVCALQTVQQTLAVADIQMERQIQVQAARRNEISDWMEF